jgi:hypothetical protein
VLVNQRVDLIPQLGRGVEVVLPHRLPGQQELGEVVDTGLEGVQLLVDGFMGQWCPGGGLVVGSGLGSPANRASISSRSWP